MRHFRIPFACCIALGLVGCGPSQGKASVSAPTPGKRVAVSTGALRSRCAMQIKWFAQGEEQSMRIVADSCGGDDNEFFEALSTQLQESPEASRLQRLKSIAIMGPATSGNSAALATAWGMTCVHAAGAASDFAVAYSKSDFHKRIFAFFGKRGITLDQMQVDNFYLIAKGTPGAIHAKACKHDLLMPSFWYSVADDGERLR